MDVAWKKVGDLRESLAKVNSELNAAPQIEVAYHELLEACRKGCHGDALRWINEHSDNERFDR